MYKEKGKSVSETDIAIDMINYLLIAGKFGTNHNFYSDLKYKRILYSNTGWRRFLIFLTGALYKPNRWIIYIGISTVLFTGVYSCFPQVQFLNTVSDEIVKFDIARAFIYSVFQIVGHLPANYKPSGITEILTYIHLLFNSMCIANLLGSWIKKYMCEDSHG